jgi:hypothetical protein
VHVKCTALIMCYVSAYQAVMSLTLRFKILDNLWIGNHIGIQGKRFFSRIMTRFFCSNTFHAAARSAHTTDPNVHVVQQAPAPHRNVLEVPPAALSPPRPPPSPPPSWPLLAASGQPSLHMPPAHLQEQRPAASVGPGGA